MSSCNKDKKMRATYGDLGLGTTASFLFAFASSVSLQCPYMMNHACLLFITRNLLSFSIKSFADRQHIQSKEISTFGTLILANKGKGNQEPKVHTGALLR
jgi:hypothetical protein